MSIRFVVEIAQKTVPKPRIFSRILTTKSLKKNYLVKLSKKYIIICAY